MHPVIRSEKMLHLDQHITDTAYVLFESWGVPCYAFIVLMDLEHEEDIVRNH